VSAREPVEVSASAKAKASSKRTPDGLPVHSLTTLLADLSTLTLNDVTLPNSAHPFTLLTEPTPLHNRAFELLQINPSKGVVMKMAARKRPHKALL